MASLLIHGKHDIKVHSDHQPLETIFKKPLSRTLCRLQRMMLKLQKYRLPLVIRKRKSFLQTVSREATSVHDDRTPTVMQECVVFHKQFYNQIGQSSFAWNAFAAIKFQLPISSCIETQPLVRLITLQYFESSAKTEKVLRVTLGRSLIETRKKERC